MSLTLIAVAVVALGAGIAIGLWLGRRGGPAELTDVLQRAAGGDLTARVRDDEGPAATALNRLLDMVGELVRVSGETHTRLTTSTGRLTTLVADMVAGAQGSVQASAEVLRASQEVSENIATLAAGSEEMGASIQEISRSASEAVSVAANAVAVSSDAGRTMTKLGESSAQIGDVVRVITAIAEQTNLLALNATIEAARAGEMGKGFAVVASEVKDLAQETAKATDDITARVGAMQSDTTGVVDSIAQIGEVIHRVNGYQTTIASAVEEQHATVDTMTQSIAAAAARAGEIAETMAAVSEARRQAQATVERTGEVTGELTDVNARLAAAMSQFRL